MNCKKYQRFVVSIILFIALFAQASKSGDNPITLDMTGNIGPYPANIVITMNGNKVTGYYWFTSHNAPQSGKISLSGSCKWIRIPDVPHYPLYKANFTAKDPRGGRICGKWDVEFETRTGSIVGICTINGYRYEVEAWEEY